MRSENQILMAIEIAEAEKEKSTNAWAEFFEDVGERPTFATNVCGVTLNCAECQEFDSFISGLRYALGEEGDDID